VPSYSSPTTPSDHTPARANLVTCLRAGATENRLSGRMSTALVSIVARKRVFLSFRAEDKEKVAGLRLLAANPSYDLEFYDESVRVPIDSTNAAYVKRKILERINRTTVTVVLISELTHTSAWVDWELQASRDKRNAIIAMAIKGVASAVLPRLVRDLELVFHAWDPQLLGDLIARS
jgi:hypothetical protein